MRHATHPSFPWPATEGEMAGRVRTRDWTTTPLGAVESWPQSLKAAVDIMLAAPGPAAILWGPARIQLYNDAYVPVAGEGHPAAFGASASPADGLLTPARLDRAFAGEAVAVGEHRMRPASPASGAGERVFAGNLLPLRGDDGVVAGVLLQLAEVAAPAQERLRGVLDGMDEGFVLLAPDFTILDHNREALRLDGRPGRQIVGRSQWEACPGSEHSELGRALKRAMKERVSVAIEHSHVAPDGHALWLDMRAVPAADGTLAVFWRDATGRKRDAERLRLSEARYGTLFESIDSGFCLVEVDLGGPDRPIDYRVIEANPAFYRQTGFPEAILGLWLREAVPGLEEHWFETYGRVARTGEPERFEQGSAALGRWFDVYAFRAGEPDGRRVAILFNDISARRNAEERLRELNETLEAQVAARSAERDRLWNLSQDMLARAGYNGMMTAVSPAWTQVLGWSEGELLTRGYATFMHADDMPPTLAAIGRMAETRQPTRFENRIATAAGGWKHIEWTVAPEPDGANFIAVGRDLSHAKAREAELEAAHEALRQSQKMEAVGQLTGGLAHDFNNLLAGISGSLDMIQTRVRQGRVAEIERYMVGAQGAAKRAAALTHRLLAFSRRQTLEPKPTDVDRLIAGMEDLIQRTVGPQILVETARKGDLWPTLVDPNQLENALLNLCINARDAMPDGGRIRIETANRRLEGREARERDLPPGHYVSMCVSDVGTGMTQDVVARAFDPFFTTKPIGVGTGLGLSMIYGFARQSGGQARIQSEVGRGTTVCLYLPRHDTDEVIETEAGSSEMIQNKPSAKTVLVVDDEPLVRMLVVDVVEELGLIALEAGDGPEALAILRSEAAIDLLVTDVGLPNGMNGRQVADAARELRPGLKVMFVTGYAETTVLGGGQLGPGMQVVTKPFDMGALANRIGGMISDREAPPDERQI